MPKLIRLPYGNSFKEISLPDREKGYVVLSGMDFEALADPVSEIKSAMQNPIGCFGLKDRISRDNKVVIITTDNTRACPDDVIVPAILSELKGAVPRENILIIVALGLHPPLGREELVKKLGEDVVANYAVINHDPEDTVHLGFTSRGNPVEVNSLVVNADFRIATGFIEPHFFAGFSGGRKSICPGVSSAAAIRANHGYAMLSNPNSRAGILEGNPIHEDMVEQAKMAQLDFIVNVLLNREKQITRVFAGDPYKAHEAGCVEAQKTVMAEIERKADICIITNSGAPLDLDFYQTCKAIDTASPITREGGIIIAVSSCTSGLGPESFVNLHAFSSSPEEVLHKISTGKAGGVSWQNQILARAQMMQQVYLLSELDDEQVKKMMVTPIHSVEEGLENALKVVGDMAEITVIPEGPLVLPSVKHT